MLKRSIQLMRSVLLIAPLALMGCVGFRSFETIEPLTFKPNPIAPLDAILVSSLTPTFRWRQPDPALPSDFAIWSAGPKGMPEDLVYYAQAIKGCEHRVSTPLKPDTDYFWSVRLSTTNKWATMRCTRVFIIPTPVVGVGGYSTLKAIPFKIRTPKQVEAQAVTKE